MNYVVFVTRRSQKQLASLPFDARNRISTGIRSLAQNPRPVGCRKLTGRQEWRIRVGDYRVLYDIDDEQQAVTVFHVGHRRDIYDQSM
jgi:mRNA interferase RelE/StbE